MNIENLKKAREAAGYTQLQAAEKLGVSDGTYKNYEQGKREPNGEKLIALAELFNVTTDYLLGRDKGNADPIELLPLGLQDRTIVQAYINLPSAERTKLVEILKKLAAGAELNVTVEEKPTLSAEAAAKKKQNEITLERVARGEQAESPLSASEEAAKIRGEKLEDPNM